MVIGQYMSEKIIIQNEILDCVDNLISKNWTDTELKIKIEKLIESHHIMKSVILKNSIGCNDYSKAEILR